MTEPDRIWINDKWEAYLRPTFDGDTSGYVRADLATPAAMTPEVRALDTFYIDCEFDGHDGPLLSIAMVRGDGYSLHVQVNQEAKDPWVIANVLPIMETHKADVRRIADPEYVGHCLLTIS